MSNFLKKKKNQYHLTTSVEQVSTGYLLQKAQKYGENLNRYHKNDHRFKFYVTYFLPEKSTYMTVIFQIHPRPTPRSFTLNFYNH